MIEIFTHVFVVVHNILSAVEQTCFSRKRVLNALVVFFRDVMSGIIKSTYILLRIQTPKAGVINVEAENTWKIIELKEFVSETINIPPECLILFFKETSLEDSNFVHNYGLTDGKKRPNFKDLLR